MANANIDFFAANIRYLMRRKKIEDVDLALALRMDTPRIRSWLRGVCFPKQVAIVKLCEYFEYYNIFKLMTENIKAKPMKSDVHERDIEMLRHYCDGVKTNAIADRHGISVRTVEEAFERLRKGYGAVSTPNLISILFREGVIQ